MFFRSGRQRRLAGEALSVVLEICVLCFFWAFQAMMTVWLFAIKNSFGEHVFFFPARFEHSLCVRVLRRVKEAV